MLKRKQIGAFKSDKYFLALTATSLEDNFSIGEIGEKDETGKQDAAEGKTKILSSWEHSYKHFTAQLHNLKNPRRHSKIKRTLLEVLQVLNCKRFLSGADNRLHGIQLNKVETCNLVLFTASPRMSSTCINQFKKVRPDNGPEFFDEAFKWDQ